MGGKGGGGGGFRATWKPAWLHTPLQNTVTNDACEASTICDTYHYSAAQVSVPTDTIQMLLAIIVIVVCNIFEPMLSIKIKRQEIDNQVCVSQGVWYWFDGKGNI